MLREPLDDGRNEGRGVNGAGSDSHFSGRWVSEKLDVLHRLVQVIEYGRSAIEQRTTVGSRRHTLGVAIEQLTPNARSSSAIDLETAGWVILRTTAALFMLPACSTAIRIWMSRSFMRLAM
jgi:hypothetical protein